MHSHTQARPRSLRVPAAANVLDPFYPRIPFGYFGVQMDDLSDEKNARLLNRIQTSGQHLAQSGTSEIAPIELQQQI